MVLEKGGSAIEAVKKAVIVLEDCRLFNAGKGSVYTNSGDIEMDAAIMDGKRLRAGAIAGVSYIKNPILLAHTVMKKSKHVLISGEKALDYAKEHGLVMREKSYFEDEFRYKQYLQALKKDHVSLDHDDSDKKFGTVGAVALDKKGNLASATSTGGMVNKKYGRIGDSPLIGIGTYANNKSCAISCTGHGEYFIRTVVAHEISARMLYKGESLKEASEEVVFKTLLELGGRGGLIGIDFEGNVVMPFNTKGMYRGFKTFDKEEFVDIFE
jgi:beta-aspartyl-peptidase (threonine type)